MTLKNRQKISVTEVQYRDKRPDSKRILFISCEGPVTEEIYFNILSENIFHGIKTKIQIISVREDFNSIKPGLRMREDIDEQNRSTPRQVMERIDDFRNQKKDLYMFEQNPDDEFWLVVDIDDHTDKNHIDEWNKVLNECSHKKYKCAISNPFFEIWLYLHHLDVSKEAYTYAVTDTHAYEKTTYFIDEIKATGAKMTGKSSKKPHVEDYTLEKVKKAIQQAKSMHMDKQEKWPSSLGTTVYLLVQEMIEMVNYQTSF